MIEIERIWCSEIDEQNAINATEAKDCNQKAMAGFYADCILCDVFAKTNGFRRVNFARVNDAIIRRWPKGLSRIKTLAWKLIEKR